ncbi:MAG: hypothetical protein JOZ24_00710, partial [Candidatus Eremiobacteraeota bacterium]|nr:hypothetical protein [Candidatus Eremiobacteraeota bacterium]
MIEASTTDLRPLGAGELLDRAVSLYVRRFVAIVAVLAVVTIPVLILGAIEQPDPSETFSDIAKVLSSTGDRAASRAAAQRLARAGRVSFGPQVLFVVLSIAANVLQWSAVIAALAAAYA